MWRRGSDRLPGRGAASSTTVSVTWHACGEEDDDEGDEDDDEDGDDDVACLRDEDAGEEDANDGDDG